MPKATQTCKSYDRIKPELDKAKKEEIDDALIKGKREEKIDMVKEMQRKIAILILLRNLRNLLIEDIDKIKADMDK